MERALTKYLSPESLKDVIVGAVKISQTGNSNTDHRSDNLRSPADAAQTSASQIRPQGRVSTPYPSR